MSFVDPVTIQDPTTNVVAVFGWGDAVNGSMNFLRNAKAGCRVTSAVGTATGTDTVLPWATETYDVNGCHDNVTNNSRITVPSSWAGLWLVGASVRGSSGLFTLTIAHTLAAGGATRIAASSSNALGSVVSTVDVDVVWVAAVGDYFECWMTGGTSRDTGVASSFWAHHLHSGN